MAVSGVFARQRKHTRQSSQLLILFIVALFVIACVMHLQAGLISFVLGHSGEDGWLFSNYALMLMGGAYGMIMLGAMFRYLELRAGGSVVARHYGAVAIKLGSGGTKKEKTLLTVIDEISIAATEKPVPLWLLPMERAVNAFVVGKENDYALVVTRGALETLNTKQLRAMVAHEIAHISNDDIPLNMRVLIALSGLLAITQIARMAINSNFLPATIVGYALHLFGMAGAFGASIIAMAFTRQREFLADAKAVQFTRNPSGFAEALNFGADSQYSTRLHGTCADEIENFCFLPFGEKKISNLFLSQPSVDERITRIDPYFRVRNSTDERKKSREENPETVADLLGLGVVSQAMYSNTTASGLTLEPVDNVPINVSAVLPDQLIFALQTEHASEAILFAILLYHFDGTSALFLKAMELKGKREQSVLVDRFQTTLSGMLESYEGEIISYVAEHLKKSHSIEELNALYRELLQISTLDGSHGLHEFLLLERIAFELGIDTESASQDASLTLEESVGLILALVVGASGQGDSQQQARYEKVLKVYDYSMVKQDLLHPKSLIDNLKRAFVVVVKQMPAVREAIVMHCAEIILDDAHVTRAEQDLISLLSASLKVETPALH